MYEFSFINTDITSFIKGQETPSDVIAAGRGPRVLYAKGKEKSPTPPSKLKDGDKVKTPNKYKNEFQKNKDGSYTHKKTGWVATKAKAGEKHGGDHWDMKPPRGGHINVGPEGNIY